ncbi:hypothetical protein FRZ67_04500 [Panacibacter ginsenosidivorans]|uniref:Uncharacterized protein n=1 Tax=Panacibacter ginsenosidivorans TaxID=1813871 RepID=A0A5B8V5U5_9BACT|nr:hypothetical protein [Panacibacter ginsenosidivorans]QEC66592.1 hypothetical protein FRZ67_04500 [Panacibacter ginsenosidivorans]
METLRRKDNIIVIDTFYLIKRGRSGVVADHPGTVYEYVICNFKGKFILIFPAIRDEQVSIKDYLKSLLGDLTTKQNEYQQSDTNIKNGKFWTFSQMVSYTTTFSDMKPISRAANWIYWFHNFIVAGFFISFLSSLFRPDVPKSN